MSPHPSGLQLRISLCNPHPSLPFRSGEIIEGTIHIFRQGGVVDLRPINIRSLSLEAYFESRTLFWHIVSNSKTYSKCVPAAARERNFQHVMAHEVHRGQVPR